MANTDSDAINKNTYNFYLVIEVPGHICPCRQNITDTHKRLVHDPVLLSQDRNYTCFYGNGSPADIDPYLTHRMSTTSTSMLDDIKKLLHNICLIKS